jgi:predicted permease
MMPEEVLSSNDAIATAIAGVVVALHLGGLAWWRGMVPPLLNALMAAVVLAWNFGDLEHALRRPMNSPLLVLMGTEFAILLASILALRGGQWAGRVSRLAYVGHLMLSLLALGLLLGAGGGKPA